MNYELISDIEYQGLPEDDEQCFVEFESICRRNMSRMIDVDTAEGFEITVKEQYMASVSAVARECGIPNIDYNPNGDSFNQTFSNFILAVQGEVARIRIRQRGDRHPHSVLLTDSTRTKIEHYISRIRDIVDRSEMDLDRKKKLNEKLDKFSNELKSRRLSFAKSMTILAGVTAGVAGVTTIAAEGQNAITNIMKLIGQDKDSEDAAAKRLSPPAKALPSPERRSSPTLRTTNYDLDDDIPF